MATAFGRCSAGMGFGGKRGRSGRGGGAAVGRLEIEEAVEGTVAVVVVGAVVLEEC